MGHKQLPPMHPKAQALQDDFCERYLGGASEDDAGVMLGKLRFVFEAMAEGKVDFAYRIAAETLVDMLKEVNNQVDTSSRQHVSKHLDLRVANAVPADYMDELAQISQTDLLLIANIGSSTIDKIAAAFDALGMDWHGRWNGSDLFNE